MKIYINVEKDNWTELEADKQIRFQIESDRSIERERKGDMEAHTQFMHLFMANKQVMSQGPKHC